MKNRCKMGYVYLHSGDCRIPPVATKKPKGETVMISEAHARHSEREGKIRILGPARCIGCEEDFPGVVVPHYRVPCELLV